MSSKKRNKSCLVTPGPLFPDFIVDYIKGLEVSTTQYPSSFPTMADQSDRSLVPAPGGGRLEQDRIGFIWQTEEKLEHDWVV